MFPLSNRKATAPANHDQMHFGSELGHSSGPGLPPLRQLSSRRLPNVSAGRWCLIFMDRDKADKPIRVMRCFLRCDFVNPQRRRCPFREFSPDHLDRASNRMSGTASHSESLTPSRSPFGQSSMPKASQTRHGWRRPAAPENNCPRAGEFPAPRALLFLPLPATPRR